MKTIIRSRSMLLILLLAVSFPPCFAGEAEKAPEELAAADKAKDIAFTYAQKLTGAWGDLHVALIDSKKGGDFKDYESMKAVLNGFVTETGAPYIYALFPSGAIDKDSFIITVDGSEAPDDFGKELDWEPCFAIAWVGATEAGEEAREDDGGSFMISGYAAVRDSKGDVVAVLGVDYPVR